MSNPLRGVPRELRATVTAAVARGWVLNKPRGNGHFKLAHPSGQCVWVSMSPSDRQANRLLGNDIRRVERTADE